MEVAGVKWFLEKRGEFKAESISGVLRLVDAIAGRSSTKAHKDIHDAKQLSFPEHFGYSTANLFGDAFMTDRYFVDYKQSRVAYPAVFPEYRHLWKFTPADYERLDTGDPSVLRVYNNGEFWAYYVRARSK